MPGKHNAGGCGCCDAGPPCFNGCPEPESVIISNSNYNDSCTASNPDGTYALGEDGDCADNLGTVDTATCTGEYDTVAFGINLSIFYGTGPNFYQMTVETSVQYGDDPDGGIAPPRAESWWFMISVS